LARSTLYAALNTSSKLTNAALDAYTLIGLGR
jgi:hypothetical protein